MPLLSFSSAPTKGASSTVTLDKTLLLALSEISSDPYWSDADNIKTAVLCYQSSVGKQDKILSFDFTQVAPTATITLSSKARDSFLVKTILLKDFDGGDIVIDRSQFSVGTLATLSGFDIDLSGGGGGSSGSTTVSSLWKGENINPIFPTDAIFTANTASYVVAAGVMTLTLNMSATSAGFVGGNAGNGRYYIDIPGGYSIASSVNVGDILGTGTGGHGGGNFPVRGEVTTMASAKRIGLWIPAFDTTWWNPGFGAFFYNGSISINIVLTIPVV